MLLDIIVILIIGLSVFIGWKRGLTMTLFSILSLVAAFAISAMLSPIISSGLEKTSLPSAMQPGLSSFVEDNLLKEFEENATIAMETATEKLPLPSFITDDLMEKTIEGSEKPIKEISDKVAFEISIIICHIISFVIVFIITLILLQILKFVLKLATKLPIISSIDKTGGLIAGFVMGVIIVYLCLFGLFALSYVEGVQGILEMANKSILTKFLYKNNIIGIII